MKTISADKPILATIIPTYNNAILVKEAISSILNQPEKNIIVVVVDDGSTDNTLDILKHIERKEKRLIIISQENKGVSAARNRGINECIRLGVQYIAFLDSDDVWCDKVFDHKLISCLKDQNYELLGFGYYNGNYQLKRGRYRAANKEIKKYTAHFCSYIYSVRLFRLYDLRFPEGIKCNEDQAFYFLYSFHSRSYSFFDKALFIHRTNRNSVSHTKHDLDDLYFNHIIPAWDWAGKQVADNADAYRECETMKKTMLTEYIVEACKNGYSVKRIKESIEKSNLQYFSEEDSVWIDNESQKNYYSFYHHPYLFWAKRRIKGIIENIEKKVKDIPSIEEKRYPEILNNNQ